MDSIKLEYYWNDIPIGKHNAATYPVLQQSWGMCERKVRAILHELSLYDNGDNYILVRSASNRGFYRTDDVKTISAYRKECLSKGKSVFAPVKKINRVLSIDHKQLSLENNLRVIREGHNFKQGEVCDLMKEYDSHFDKSLLSKMENGVCMPTPYQLSKLAQIYGCTASELVNTELYI